MTEDRRQQWNAAVAAGDTARMGQFRHTIPRGLNLDIPNEDSGWATPSWRQEEPR